MYFSIAILFIHFSRIAEVSLLRLCRRTAYSIRFDSCIARSHVYTDTSVIGWRHQRQPPAVRCKLQRVLLWIRFRHRQRLRVTENSMGQRNCKTYKLQWRAARAWRRASSWLLISIDDRFRAKKHAFSVVWFVHTVENRAKSCDSIFLLYGRIAVYGGGVPDEFNLTLCLPLPEKFLSNTVIIKNKLIRVLNIMRKCVVHLPEIRAFRAKKVACIWLKIWYSSVHKLLICLRILLRHRAVHDNDRLCSSVYWWLALYRIPLMLQLQIGGPIYHLLMWQMLLWWTRVLIM